MSVLEHPARDYWFQRTAERLSEDFAAECQLVSDAALLEYVRQRRPDTLHDPRVAVEALRCLDPEGVRMRAEISSTSIGTI